MEHEVFAEYWKVDRAPDLPQIVKGATEKL